MLLFTQAGLQITVGHWKLANENLLMSHEIPTLVRQLMVEQFFVVVNHFTRLNKKLPCANLMFSCHNLFCPTKMVGHMSFHEKKNIFTALHRCVFKNGSCGSDLEMY